MKLLTGLLLLVVTHARQVIYNSEEDKDIQCGENEQFDSCGTACPLTCDNYHNPPEYCTRICIRGCHCTDGFVKSTDGSCVRAEDCPTNDEVIYNSEEDKDIQCRENEHFDSCGTACPLTCDNYQNPPEYCTRICIRGCRCNVEFVKSTDGSCVRVKDCPTNDEDIQKNCDEQRKKGLCRGFFLRWYFDQNRQNCKLFIYGGCEGNGNNYESEEECLQNCKLEIS